MQGLKALSVYVVDVIDRSAETSLAQEQKLSSSDIRRNMLGSYREAEVRGCGHIVNGYVLMLFWKFEIQFDFYLEIHPIALSPIANRNGSILVLWVRWQSLYC